MTTGLLLAPALALITTGMLLALNSANSLVINDEILKTIRGKIQQSRKQTEV
jgi:hypothetical protein